MHHLADSSSCVTLVSFCRDWNPAVDKHLPVKYDISSFKAGKAACKKALQEELGLPVNADIPLIAFIGRLDYQKGADIVLQVGNEADVQLQQTGDGGRSNTSSKWRI